MFEAQFYSTHLRKPIADERQPIKHLLVEVGAIRKQLKSKQYRIGQTVSVTAESRDYLSVIIGYYRRVVILAH